MGIAGLGSCWAYRHPCEGVSEKWEFRVFRQGGVRYIFTAYSRSVAPLLGVISGMVPGQIVPESTGELDIVGAGSVGDLPVYSAVCHRAVCPRGSTSCMCTFCIYGFASGIKAYTM